MDLVRQCTMHATAANKKQALCEASHHRSRKTETAGNNFHMNCNVLTSQLSSDECVDRGLKHQTCLYIILIFCMTMLLTGSSKSQHVYGIFHHKVLLFPLLPLFTSASKTSFSPCQTVAFVRFPPKKSRRVCGEEFVHSCQCPVTCDSSDLSSLSSSSSGPSEENVRPF